MRSHSQQSINKQIADYATRLIDDGLVDSVSDIVVSTIDLVETVRFGGRRAGVFRAGRNGERWGLLAVGDPPVLPLELACLGARCAGS